MMKTFNEFITNKQLCEPRLPLLHTCDAFGFRSIIGTKTLLPAPCQVFDGEMLIYFFYGRPAYRTSAGNVQTLISAFMPISIVLKNETINTPKRISPFDTGAFHEGLFAQHLHPNMKIEDFFVTPSMDMPQRIVNFFFGSNINYFRGKPRHVDIPPLEFEVSCYYSLIGETANLPFDDRCSAIEIQSQESVELTQDNVLLVVLPTIFMDDPKVNETICKVWNAQVETYSIHRGDPKEYVGFIYNAVEQFLTEKGYM
ncbi:hypothetical protein ACFLYX_04275 [Chloroflexota bacterium]